MVLNSLGLDKAVEIDTKNMQEKIIEYVTKKGKKIVLLQQFKN
jgi:hypothetical protein